ncbi:MAG TPA: ParB/RepB/Spo0J family partition protein [Terriglobales bacterium]|nr:ParB/RepB/Spo0J family partition protein [Terriglobales bacterium]
MTIAADKMGGQPGAAQTGATQPEASKTSPSSGAETSSATRPVLAHDKRRALGRGLESLLPGPRPAAPGAGAGSGATAAHAGTGAHSGSAASVSAGSAGTGVAHATVAAPVPGVIAEIQAQAARRKDDGHEVLDLAIALIDVNPHQTRSWTQWELESLEELSDSIKVQGVLQPITVRPGKDGRYFLITGERRMRASTMAGKATIPAIVRIVSEQQAAEMTVIENLQRRDLNCIDLARAYIMLSQDFGLTQEQIGQRVGIARETVSNYMRLAKLPQPVQVFLSDGALEYSHARVLLNLEDPDVQLRVARKAVDEDWSVDRLEKFVLFDPSMFGVKKKETKGGGGARWVDPNVRAAQRELERILAVKVRIRDHKGKGKITLEYATLEDFDRVIGMLKGKE